MSPDSAPARDACNERGVAADPAYGVASRAAALAPDEPGQVVLGVGAPAELIAVVPWLLGFRPGGRDLVVLAATPLPRSRVGLSLRYDLPESDPAVAEAVGRRAAVTAAVQGYARLVAVGFGPEEAVAPAIAALRHAAGTSGLECVELLRADAGRYWSYTCTDPACCPPGGTPYATGAGHVDEVFQAAGAPAVLDSRDALTATIAPAAGQEARAVSLAMA
jgi:hypothetical protein